MNKLYLVEYDELLDLSIIDILPSNVRNHILSYNGLRLKSSLVGYLLLVYAISIYYNKLILPDVCYDAKPYLINYDLYFNISHSNNVVVLAFSDELDMGVDIEHIREFSLRLHNKLGGNNKFESTSIWTKLEAYSKLDGKSIFSNISNIDINSNCEQLEYKDYIISVCFR